LFECCKGKVKKIGPRQNMSSNNYVPNAFTIIGMFNIFLNTLRCLKRSTPSFDYNKDVKGKKLGRWQKELESNKKKN
jgi:hypothetical protein